MNAGGRKKRNLRKKKNFIDVPLVQEASAYTPPSKYFKKNNRRAHTNTNTNKMKNNQNGKKELNTEGGVKGKDAIKKMVKKNNKNHHNRVLASINDSLLAPLKPVDDVTPRRLM